ncbi:hypothetical protein F2Q69_00038373 [Brassica cretica]|uniref:Uncharacterized protein n=1 Tax=Brassica cretica TaxID=69181 RepID=A0A8S9SF60_BRACR|nr:hypothetical protein F2Q69_00038373 [Brassica cretica]
MKSQPEFHTREEVDQLVEGIYRALETTEQRFDGRYDDIYFRMDLTISALTSKKFNLESLGDKLQRIENTTASMKDKWRIGDEAMRDFTVTWFN